MTNKVSRYEVEEIVKLCDDVDFVNQFISRIHPRIVKIIMFRHGHTCYGKMKFKEIAPFIKRIVGNENETLSDKQISLLYYRGLGKIKKLMGEDNV